MDKKKTAVHEFVTGTFNRYFPQKEYGFIHGDDGRGYFVHANKISGGIIPKRGTRCMISGYWVYDDKKRSAMKCTVYKK